MQQNVRSVAFARQLHVRQLLRVGSYPFYDATVFFFIAIFIASTFSVKMPPEDKRAHLIMVTAV